MGVINEELRLADQFSQTFRAFDAAANASIRTAEAFASALNGFSEGFLDGLTTELEKQREELANMSGEINNATGAQKDFNREVSSSEKSTSNLLSTISKIATAIGAYKLAENFVETADEMSQITAKLNMINDGSRTTLELQDAIYESAQRARGSYMDTANLVARIGMNAADAFGSNNEMILFAENLNKSFKIAGASAQEQASVILQMSQALAGGLLRGQEYTAISQGAPGVVQAIADYMGVSKGALKDLAADGKVSAEVVKYALLSATDSINDQFKSIPQTFGDVMTKAKNQIVYNLGSAFDEWIRKLGNEKMQDVIDTVTDALSTLAEVGANILIAIADGVVWIRENWETIAPIIEVVIGAMLAFKVTSIASAAATGLAWAAAHAPLLAIGGIFIALIAGADAMGADFQDIAGAIGRVFGVAIAGIYNGFVDIFNLIRDIKGEGEITGNAVADTLYDSIMHPAVGAIAGITDALGIGETAMNDIIAQNRGSSTSSIFELYKGKSISQTLDEADEMAQKLDPGRLEHISYDEAATTGEQIGRNFGASVDNLISNFENLFEAAGGEIESKSIPQDAAWYAEYYGGIKPKDPYAIEIPDYSELLKSGDVKVKTKGEVKLADEDLKIFRDIAESRYIANVDVQTLAPVITTNIENGQNLTAEDVSEMVAGVLIEQRNAHTSTSHG